MQLTQIDFERTVFYSLVCFLILLRVHWISVVPVVEQYCKFEWKIIYLSRVHT